MVGSDGQTALKQPHLVIWPNFNIDICLSLLKAVNHFKHDDRFRGWMIWTKKNNITIYLITIHNSVEPVESIMETTARLQTASELLHLHH